MQNDLLIQIEEKCKDADNIKGLNNILHYLNNNKKMYKIIFNANIEDINAYVIKKISTEMREPIFDE